MCIGEKFCFLVFLECVLNSFSEFEIEVNFVD